MFKSSRMEQMRTPKKYFCCFCAGKGTLQQQTSVTQRGEFGELNLPQFAHWKVLGGWDSDCMVFLFVVLNALCLFWLTLWKIMLKIHH